MFRDVYQRPVIMKHTWGYENYFAGFNQLFILKVKLFFKLHVEVVETKMATG